MSLTRTPTVQQMAGFAHLLVEQGFSAAPIDRSGSVVQYLIRAPVKRVR